MIIYKDILNEGEVLSDAYKCKIVQDLLLEVEGRYTTEKTEITDAMIGGNKSAEDEGGDDADDASRHGIDVVMASNLREFPCSKDECRKGLRKYAKKIFAKLEESNPEAGKIFKEKAADVIKSLLSKFDDLQVFTVEDPNMDPCDAEAMFIFVEFVGDKPFLYYFKDGLLEEKM